MFLWVYPEDRSVTFQKILFIIVTVVIASILLVKCNLTIMNLTFYDNWNWFLSLHSYFHTLIKMFIFLFLCTEMLVPYVMYTNYIDFLIQWHFNVLHSTLVIMLWNASRKKHFTSLWLLLLVFLVCIL